MHVEMYVHAHVVQHSAPLSLPPSLLDSPSLQIAQLIKAVIHAPGSGLRSAADNYALLA